MCISLIIVFIGAIQLVSTFHTYAVNLSELNGLKNQQAALISQKRDLENDIARWDDNAYVTAQARDRLGFVFPGEQAIRVLHPEAVTGEQPSSAQRKSANEHSQAHAPLPWYREMAYSLSRADTPANTKTPQESSSGQGSGQQESLRTSKNQDHSGE
ncbi:hypothetical protein KIMH_05600 [Bombiscardovia apis]|uniref:Septum formation initiator n=1 Tax=Bombiscardovia apis TaxID=2932182 RepID=A0ABM8BC08_9BIFI|nr:hypothetical protein KIMH_05600 [Bombiscardovia apis]